MAMLAEPRRKKRYILQPRKALYEDDNRFGTKMLEKMGWTKGKGLGINLEGNREFLRVNYKNDVKGVGFEDRDDQWKQHEQSFNGFLQQLNGEDNEAANAEINRDDVEDIPRIGFGFAADPPTPPNEPNKQEKKKLKEKISGASLEEMSKRSRARVHYKKFTKGKDLSQYTETDLANIFGRKADSEEQVEEKSTETDATLQTNVGPVVTKMDGVETITTGLSINDYFKQKMMALKNKAKENKYENCDNRKLEAITNGEEEISQIDDNVPDVESKQKKSKRKRKNMSDVSKEIAAEQGSGEEALEQSAEEVPRKKSKKNKEKKAEEISTSQETAEEQAVVEVELQVPPIEEAPIKKSKKKIKDKEKKSIENDELSQVASVTQEAEVIVLSSNDDDEPKRNYKKALKRKNKKNNKEMACVASVDETQPSSQLDTDAELQKQTHELAPKKKAKKSQEKAQTANNDATIIVSSDDEASVSEQPQKINEQAAKEKDGSSTANQKSKTESAEQSEKMQAIASALKPILTEKAKTPFEESPCANQPICELTPIQLDNKIARSNIFCISSFAAEKFRLVDFGKFVNSNILSLPGYEWSEDFILKINKTKNDGGQIARFWSKEFCKYDFSTPGSKYNKYRKEIHAARNEKKRIPRLKVKSFKRRNAFQGIKYN